MIANEVKFHNMCTVGAKESFSCNQSLAEWCSRVPSENNVVIEWMDFKRRQPCIYKFRCIVGILLNELIDGWYFNSWNRNQCTLRCTEPIDSTFLFHNFSFLSLSTWKNSATMSIWYFRWALSDIPKPHFSLELRLPRVYFLAQKFCQ